MTIKSLCRRRALATIIITLLALCPAVRPLAQDRAGQILDIGGEWFAESEPGRNLQRAAAVRAGWVIRPRRLNDPRSFIIITDINGRVSQRRYCALNGCGDPLRVLAPAAPPGILSRLYASVAGLWGGDAPKYKTHGSRGVPGTLKEAVVALNAEGIDMSRVFEDMPAGTYRIRFVRAPCHVLPCTTVVGPTRITWTPGTPAKFPAAGLTAGLYEVQLMRANANLPQSIGTEAWVLIAPPARFDALSRSFDDVLNLTKQWESDMESLDEGARPRRINRTTISSFLRAALDHLAAEQGRAR